MSASGLREVSYCRVGRSWPPEYHDNADIDNYPPVQRRLWLVRKATFPSVRCRVTAIRFPELNRGLFHLAFLGDEDQQILSAIHYCNRQPQEVHDFITECFVFDSLTSSNKNGSISKEPTTTVG